MLRFLWADYKVKAHYSTSDTYRFLVFFNSSFIVVIRGTSLTANCYAFSLNLQLILQMSVTGDKQIA